MVAKLGEEGKVALRNVRREAMKAIERLEKEGALSEDARCAAAGGGRRGLPALQGGGTSARWPGAGQGPARGWPGAGQALARGRQHGGRARAGWQVLTQPPPPPPVPGNRSRAPCRSSQIAMSSRSTPWSRPRATS